MRTDKKFMDYYYAKSIKQIRVFFIIAILTYDLSGIADMVFVPELQYKFWLVRYAFFTPLAIITIAYTFKKGFEKYYQIWISLLAFAGGIGLIFIHFEAVSFQVYSYQYGILLLIIFVYFLSRLRFSYAAFIGWLNVILFNVFAYIYNNVPWIEFTDTNVLLIAFNTIGMAACYFMDSYEVKNYELLESLKKEKEKVKNASDLTFQRIFDGSTDTIFLIEDEKITDCNAAAIKHFGCERKAELIGKSLCDLAKEVQPDGATSKTKYKKHIDDTLDQTTARFEWWAEKKDGIDFPLDIIFTLIIIHEKQLIHALCRDVSEQKKLERRLIHLSYRDQLTNLYNRRFFDEKIRGLYAEKYLPITFVIGDVNGLKLINDSFGHQIGDELLLTVAQTLSNACRTEDMIARIGGDEFAIFLPFTDENHSEKIINRIKHKLGEQKVHSLDVSVSFGWETIYTLDERFDEIYKNAENKMYKRKLFEGPSIRGNTIKAVLNTLHEKNKREEQHSHRVSELCEKMGRLLDLNENEVKELKSVGLLHDIGKVAIDENILNKQGILTVEERFEINRHSEIGYRIISTVNDMADMAEYVLYHHERWDGRGYPKGLRGEEIPLQSRIVTVADSFDAMTSDRSYRKGLSKEAAIEELLRNAGTQFDARLVKIFIEKVLV